VNEFLVLTFDINTSHYQKLKLFLTEVALELGTDLVKGSLLTEPSIILIVRPGLSLPSSSR